MLTSQRLISSSSPSLRNGKENGWLRRKKERQEPGKTGVNTGKRGWEAGRRQEENDGQLGMGPWLPAAGPWSGC